jgi:hypothetical protein
MVPSFIIAGAPRAGTTYLYHVLDQHPEIYLAKPRTPEPKFFLVDEEFAKGLAYYRQRWFAAAGPGQVTGEKSTNYLEDPRVAERIRQCLPEVKLVFALRDPVQRAFSNYLWSRKNGLETLEFDEALRREAEREAAYPPELRYSRPFSYVSRGMYAKLLKPFFGAFPAAQVRVVMQEELEAAPRPALDDLCRFLGVAPLPPEVDLAVRINSARQSQETMPEAVRRRLSDIYRGPNADLARLLGRELPWRGTNGTRG